MNSKKCRVVFQPSGRRGTVEKGISVLEAARRLGVGIEAVCGGDGVCGKCIVRIEENAETAGIRSSRSHVSEWLPDVEAKFITDAEREKGCRLSCKANILDDVLVYVPEASRAGKQIVSKAARAIPINLDPAVKIYQVTLEPPSAENSMADFDRLKLALAEKYGVRDLSIDIACLRNLPSIMRRGLWSVTVSVWKNAEIIRVQPGRIEKAYGIAIDIGTTTLAAYLCDLTTGEVVNTAAMMNPQCKYGEDVMSRIAYHQNNPDGLAHMRTDIISGVNRLMKEAVSESALRKDAAADQSEPLDTDDIVDVSVCFNTVMHHIFLGIDPDQLGMSPFPPAINQSLDLRARDLGLKVNPSAHIFVLPTVAGFVGADAVGVLIAEELYNRDRLELIIDIGTNGELLLGSRDRIVSTSCATGPALEGAQITFGMRAAPGAIERIKIDPNTLDVDYKVIGRDAWRSYSTASEMRAKGICGSGILDVPAEFFRTGIINRTGAFDSARLEGSPRFRKNPGAGGEFVLAWAEETAINRDIVITQKDIRQIQLAKGALYAGCKLMLKYLDVETVDAVKIAGAFGTHVDPEKALIMGLFPDCEIEKIQSVGNAAGDGCRAALLDLNKRKEADEYAKKLEHINLGAQAEFQSEFVAAMYFPHSVDEFPNLKGLIPEDEV